MKFVLNKFFIGMLIIVFLVIPKITLATPVSILQFGTYATGSGFGTALDPKSIAITSSGDMYVLEYGNSYVSKFNSAGVFQSLLGSAGTGNGQFRFPAGIAIDSSGNIYISNYENHRVQKFNSSGVYQLQFGTFGSGNGQFNAPSGVAVDSENNVYVTDFGNSRVQKFNSSGVYQSQFGSSGSSDGQFRWPFNLAIDDNDNIYVSDFSNNRVQKFNSSGVYQSQFGSSGSGEGEFSGPQGIDFDSSGNIYVVDSGNHRVQKFNSSGTYQSQFSSRGSGIGQLYYPWGIAIDSSDYIFVVDKLNGRIQKFKDTPPVVSSPNNNSTTPANQFTISGSCKNGLTVTAIVDSVPISPTALCSSSAFSITPSQTITTGSHTIVTTQKDAGLNISAQSNQMNFTITASSSTGTSGTTSGTSTSGTTTSGSTSGSTSGTTSGTSTSGTTSGTSTSGTTTSGTTTGGGTSGTTTGASTSGTSTSGTTTSGASTSGGGTGGTSGSGGGGSGAGGGGVSGLATSHKYPVSSNASPISLSITNIPTASNNVAKLKWSSVLNATSMSFSLDPKFTGVLNVPFKQEANFTLPKNPGTYNIYAKVISSTNDFVQLGPLVVKIESKSTVLPPANNTSKLTVPKVASPATNTTVTKPKAVASVTKTSPIVVNNPSTTAKISTSQIVNEIPVSSNICKFTKSIKITNKLNNKNEVKMWQEFLNKFEGEGLEVNGIYDLDTQEAILRFQTVYNLKADGIIGLGSRTVANKIKGCN